MEHGKRNYLLFFTDTILFTNLSVFISVNVVITSFLNALGASTFEISLASALSSIGMILTQPIFAKKAMELKYKGKTFSKILFFQRAFFLIFVCTIPLLSSYRPQTMIIIFLLCWTIFNFFVGSYTPFYMSLLSKMVSQHQRGRLVGFAGAVGNIIAIGSAFITSLLLKQLAYPYNYTVVLGIGAVLLIFDAAVFGLMKEPPDTIVEKQMGYFQYFKDIPKILKGNRKFFKMVVGYCFFIIANISLVYYALFAIRKYGAKPSQVALFAVVTVVINTIGSVCYGMIADHFGHRLVLRIAATFGTIAAITVLFIHSLLIVFIAFALSSLCAGGYFLSSNMLIIQESPSEQLPVFISVNSMITLIVSTAITLLSSVIIDTFSFTPMFLIAGLAAVGAYCIFNFALLPKDLNVKKQHTGKKLQL